MFSFRLLVKLNYKCYLQLRGGLRSTVAIDVKSENELVIFTQCAQDVFVPPYKHLFRDIASVGVKGNRYALS